MVGHMVAPFYKAMPAEFLNDTVSAIRDSKLRTWLRGIIFCLVAAATVALTVLQYTTDNSIKSPVDVTRVDLVKDIGPKDAENGFCPCQKIWVPFGSYMELNTAAQAAVNTNITDFIQKTCDDEVIKQFPAETSATRTNHVQDAAQNLCIQTLTIVIPVINNINNETDLLVTPTLLAENATKRAYDVYVGQVIVEQVRGSLLAYNSIKTAAAAVRKRAECLATATTDAECADQFNQVAAISTAAPAVAATIGATQRALEEAAANIVVAFGDYTNPETVGEVLKGTTELVKGLAKSNWTKYRDQCNPRYCDVFGKKSVFTRIVEFFTTFGGVLQTITIIAMTLWLIIDCCLRGDNTYITPTAPVLMSKQAPPV